MGSVGASLPPVGALPHTLRKGFIMDCYNVKCKHFKHGDVQTVIHSRLIQKGVKRKECNADRLESDTTEELSDADREVLHLRSVRNSMKRSLNKIYDISRANSWDYFVTLTFNPDKVDRYSYDDCSKKLSQWLKDLKKRVNPDFMYLVVPELHKDGAYHFHGLFAHCDGLCIVPSGHFDKSGKVVYNIGSYRLGFTTATAVGNQQAVNKYITKYVTKDLCEATKGKKRYWASRNCESPIEETFAFDFKEKNLIRRELSEDSLHVKICDYDIGSRQCMTEYFENQGGVFNIPDPEF